MKRIFNVAGPCQPQQHYMVEMVKAQRDVMALIEQSQYFVIHAARQTGKTTLLLSLAEKLSQQGHYYVMYCSLETAQQFSDPSEGIPTIIQRLQLEVELNNQFAGYVFAENIDLTNYGTALLRALSKLCSQLDKPLVILFDEVDCLSNGTLISFLRQLRDGYVNRGRIPFVHAIALVGMRNIRDYKGKIREERETLGSASPFNIVTESLGLRNFTLEEVTEFYHQHTVETGQVFSEAVITEIYRYTQGQPWLVNALAREIVVKELENDFSRAIEVAQVVAAAENIIKQRATHIDSLMERLKEARVQEIIEPLILGEERVYDSSHDHYQYVLDLGLIKEEAGRVIPSNPIYAEVIIRTLSHQTQMALTYIPTLRELPSYIQAGELDMRQLLGDFQGFWRENSEMWVERYQYKEAAPHLILQAYLQRVVNSGGRLTREMALGAGRLDLCLYYGSGIYPIELKIRYNEQSYTRGVTQLRGYMERLGCAEGWLVVFDRRARVSWKKKLFWRTEEVGGLRVHVVGC
jgi:hypothetical protein